jgi:hypothetical protein
MYVYLIIAGTPEEPFSSGHLKNFYENLPGMKDGSRDY